MVEFCYQIAGKLRVRLDDRHINHTNRVFLQDDTQSLSLSDASQRIEDDWLLVPQPWQFFDDPLNWRDSHSQQWIPLSFLSRQLWRLSLQILVKLSVGRMRIEAYELYTGQLRQTFYDFLIRMRR